MGNHCGEKVKSVIAIYQLLNAVPFIPLNRKNWLCNIQTLINYWSLHVLRVISDPTWTRVEDTENLGLQNKDI